MEGMKRRVAAILDFISHTQVEMATNDPARTSQSSTITPPDSGSSKESVESMAQKIWDELDADGFAKLNSVEMMEVLTRRLMKWQMEYGKSGDK